MSELSRVFARGRARRTTRAVGLLSAAIVAHIGCAFILLPVAGHPYDFVALTGGAEAWMRWGFPLLYGWKFGFDATVLAICAQGLRSLLEVLGLSGAAAIHIAWKMPIVACDAISGLLVLRLASRFAPERATMLAVLWLANPILLWVSAGHGQVEAVAIAALFGSLELANGRHLFWAGVVTGLGTGIEYFPLAATAYVFIGVIGGHFSRRQAILFASGLIVSLALCFLPLVLDPVGLTGLTGGLTSSAGLDTPYVSPISIWALLPRSWSIVWPLAFVLLGSVCTLAVSVSRSKDLRLGIYAISAVLVFAVIVDKSAVPQFALIVAAGLWLLALVVPVQPLLLVLIPACGLVGYFLYPFDANVYWYDAWWQLGGPPFSLPPNPTVASYFNTVFVIGTIAIYGYSTVAGSLSFGFIVARRIDVTWVSACVVAAALTVPIIYGSAQPALWQSVGTTGPRELADFSWMVQSRPGIVQDLSANAVRIEYPPALMDAASRSSTKPTGGIDIQLTPLFDRERADIALPAADWGGHSVNLPAWSNMGYTTRTLWIVLLLGSPTWRTEADLSSRGLRLDVGMGIVDAAATSWVAPGWARVVYEVPSSVVRPDGMLEITPLPASIYWNGSSSGPWIRITPESGHLVVQADGEPVQLAYSVNSDGNGYAVGLPVRPHMNLLLTSSGPPRTAVVGAFMKWPDKPPRSASRNWLLIGALDALVVMFGAVLMCWGLMRGIGPLGSRPSRI
jgi:hypothetical protein